MHKDFSRCARRHGSAVRPEHHIWVKGREKRVEVPSARSREEGVDNFSLASEVGDASRVRSLNPAACAARELPCRSLGTAHDRSDLVERQVEHVVQHERETLGGIQGLEHHEQRETDRVGELRFVLWIRNLLAMRNRLRPLCPSALRDAICASAACPNRLGQRPS